MVWCTLYSTNVVYLYLYGSRSTYGVYRMSAREGRGEKKGVVRKREARFMTKERAIVEFG